jgi:putative chitinase
MSIIQLQHKIGVTPDGDFGPKSIKAAMVYFKLTPLRAAHFFGQTSHETGGFSVFSENLNYNSTGLKKTFGKYFPGNLSDLYTRQPEKIANHVYANRMGNGNEISRDGWKFRGRGAIQLTGRENYLTFAQSIGKPEIMVNPDLVAGQYAFESAIFFFNKNKLWSICDQGLEDKTIKSLTKKINGGFNGLEERIEKTKKYFNYIKG